MGAGLAVAAHSVAVAVLVFAYLAVTITAAIRSEEAHLTDKFGGDYPAYRERDGARRRRAASASSARCRNREYRALLGFLAVLAAARGADVSVDRVQAWLAATAAPVAIITCSGK